MKKGDLVKVVSADVYSHMAGRCVKVGTLGNVLSTRGLSKEEPEVLVKFKGFGWPISLKASEVKLV